MATKVAPLVADGEVARNLEQRRESAGGGADSDEQVGVFGAHGAPTGANLLPRIFSQIRARIFKYEASQ